MNIFLPKIKVIKSDDIITILIRQRYRPRGGPAVAHRWRIAGQYSLKQIEKEENSRRNPESKISEVSMPDTSEKGVPFDP